jgi:hypothetical protein
LSYCPNPFLDFILRIFLNISNSFICDILHYLVLKLLTLFLFLIISTSIVGILSPNAYAAVPSAPTNLTNSSEPTSDTIVLSWSTPSSNGGKTITGYKIEKATETSPGTFSSYADHNANTRLPDTTLTISGLSAPNC